MSGNAKAKLAKARRLAKKKTVSQLVRVRAGPLFHVDEAIRIVRATGSATGFSSTVNLQVQLGIDPRKTEQAVRGTAALPFGTGKKVIVAVFARGEKAEEARKAGAAIVGDVDLAERVAKGELGFTKAIATPDMMSTVGRVARILGPRGLMPNPKMGTVTVNIREAVQAAMRGAADFRSEKRGIVSSAVGKAGFSESDLRANIRAFILCLWSVKPETFRGTFFKQLFLSSTSGPAVPLDLEIVDPSSPRFFSPWDGSPAHLQEGFVAKPLHFRKLRPGVTGSRRNLAKRRMRAYSQARAGGVSLVVAEGGEGKKVAQEE